VRKLAISVLALTILCFLALPAAFADSTNLQDALLVVTGPGSGGVGNVATDAYPLNGDSGTGWSVATTGFGSSTLGTSVYGAYTVTITASTTGTYYADLYVNLLLNTPAYNEYSTPNGTATAGVETWETGAPGSTTAPSSGTVENDVATETTLSDNNGVPGQTSNYLHNCTASDCNATVGMALGFEFSLDAGQTETVIFDITETAPSGFYIDQTHPVDGDTTSAVNAYFSGSATAGVVAPPPPPPKGVPEPGTLLMLGSSLCGLLGFRKRLA